MKIQTASLQLTEGTVTAVAMTEAAIVLSLVSDSVTAATLVVAEPDLTNVHPAANAQAMPKVRDHHFVALKTGDSVPYKSTYIGTVEQRLLGLVDLRHVFLLSPDIPVLLEEAGTSKN